MMLESLKIAIPDERSPIKHMMKSDIYVGTEL